MVIEPLVGDGDETAVKPRLAAARFVARNQNHGFAMVAKLRKAELELGLRAGTPAPAIRSSTEAKATVSLTGQPKVRRVPPAKRTDRR
jgi:hypothetical protein